MLYYGFSCFDVFYCSFFLFLISRFIFVSFSFSFSLFISSLLLPSNLYVRLFKKKPEVQFTKCTAGSATLLVATRKYRKSDRKRREGTEAVEILIKLPNLLPIQEKTFFFLSKRETKRVERNARNITRSGMRRDQRGRGHSSLHALMRSSLDPFT